MEQLDLTTPTPSYKVHKLILTWPDSIKIVLIAPNGEKTLFAYSGTNAANMLVSLNKVDLSTNSLQKRILDRLILDGRITGVVNGTPD